jgi:chromosome segregation ATPase
MESAQAMYGVTMQEPGVSRLVSVKFDGIANVAASAA